MTALAMKHPDTDTGTTVRPAVTSGSRERLFDSHYAQVGTIMRKILMEDDAFRRDQADAIVEILIEERRTGKKLSADQFMARLHARGFDKNLSAALADILSRRSK